MCDVWIQILKYWKFRVFFIVDSFEYLDETSDQIIYFSFECHIILVLKLEMFRYGLIGTSLFIGWKRIRLYWMNLSEIVLLMSRDDFKAIYQRNALNMRKLNRLELDRLEYMPYHMRHRFIFKWMIHFCLVTQTLQIFPYIIFYIKYISLFQCAHANWIFAFEI